MKTVAQLLAERKKGYQNIDLTGSNLMVSKILTTMHDSFERELALREENKRLMGMVKAVVDNDQYGIVMTDLGGNIIEFNQTAENLLGQKAQQVLGVTLKTYLKLGII